MLANETDKHALPPRQWLRISNWIHFGAAFVFVLHVGQSMVDDRLYAQEAMGRTFASGVRGVTLAIWMLLLIAALITLVFGMQKNGEILRRKHVRGLSLNWTILMVGFILFLMTNPDVSIESVTMPLPWRYILSLLPSTLFIVAKTN